MDTLLVSGPCAEAFVGAAFAGKPLAVGTCAFEPALTGDGSLVAVPLLARTGEAEYVVFDATARAEVLSGWLSFLADVESEDGYRPYEGLATEEVTAAHAVLLLEGTGASRVLADYLGDQPLPVPGTVRSVRLDALEAIVVALPASTTDCYLLLVAPRHARVLWRSILSFPEVVPVGMTPLERILTRRLPWLAMTGTEDAIPADVHAQALANASLFRATPDFVGARAIRD
jgi:aminomethyltransferase